MKVGNTTRMRDEKNRKDLTHEMIIQLLQSFDFIVKNTDVFCRSLLNGAAIFFAAHSCF